MLDKRNENDGSESLRLILRDEEEANLLAMALGVALTGMHFREGNHKPFIKDLEAIYAKVAALLDFSVDELDDWIGNFAMFDIFSASNMTLVFGRGRTKPMQSDEWRQQDHETSDEEESDEEEFVEPISKRH